MKCIFIFINFMERVGLACVLFKECLQHYFNLLSGRNKFDLAAFTFALNKVGLSVLLQLTLVAIVVGSILSIQISFLLEMSNFSTLFIESLTHIIFQEFSPLLVGFFVASRSAVNLSVRLATMSLNNEINGLLMCNVNPVHFVIAPVLLAMMVISFTLVIWSNVMVIISSAFWLWLEIDISFAVYFKTIAQTLDFSLISINIIKPLVFAMVSTMIAGVFGYRKHQQAETVATAASSTMTSAFAAILFIDLLFLLLRL